MAAKKKKPVAEKRPKRTRTASIPAKSLSRSLTAARDKKQDEFYTQLSDIEKELRHYTHHFKGKTVLCNCDDPRVSNFFKYFINNFDKLGLKRVITTSYQSDKPDLFSQNLSGKGIYFDYSGEQRKQRLPDVAKIKPRELKGDGDFRSEECVNLLRQADIVVTNPPFSLFREYVAQLVKHEKKFLIIGNQNAVTYKDIFRLFKDNKVWFGPSIHSGDREFGVPDYYPLNAAGSRVDEAGNKFIRVKGVRWFTNLDHKSRHDELVLYEKYTPEKYPTYENYSAIDVGKTKEIPADFDGVMGVPITFLDKYSPEQFEIVGTLESSDPNNPYRTRWYSSQDQKDAYFRRFGKPGSIPLNMSGVINDVKVFKRILIRRKK